MTTLFCRLYFASGNNESYWTIDQRIFRSSVVQVENEVLPNGEEVEAFDVEPYTEVTKLPSDITLTRDIQLQYIGEKGLDYEEILQLATDYISGRSGEDISNDFKVTEEQKIAN